MRDTIDFGIDLGTTNSAIAVLDGGAVSVVKNHKQIDYTPSAVWMRKRGVLVVGSGALDRLDNDPDNVQIEFKQAMGLPDARREFPAAGVSMTPVELSAEVLKALREDTGRSLHEPPQAAVITVPAAFRLNQTEATQEAARLAGFTGPCQLLQEPTAAAFAFGFQNESRGAHWMVFDLGGGTFDSAVVSTVEEELSVLHHAGDTHLGGRNIDRMLVDRLLVPAVERQLGFRDFTRDNPRWQRHFAHLRSAAEAAKIELSQQEQTQVMVMLDRGDGESEMLDVTVRREEVDQLAKPFYLRAIQLCRDALDSANLRAPDIDRLLLVGGPTQAPGLRELLADPVEGLGIPLDHSQDPSTVVARGAALYAGTIALPRIERPVKRGEYSLKLSYPATSSLPMVPVSGRCSTEGEADWSRFRIALNDPERRPAYRTVPVSLSPDGTFTVDVLLAERTVNRFGVELTDPSGAPAPVQPATLTITHQPNEMMGQTVVNTVGLTEADGSFTPMLMKNTPLPASKRQTFYTTSTLRRGDTSAVIRIPVAEGERRRGDRNQQVGVIEIRARDVRFDVPRGRDVEMTFEMDESRQVTVVAYVPMLDREFEAVIDLKQQRIPDEQLLRRMLSELEARHEELRSQVETTRSDRARGLLQRLDDRATVATARDEVTAGRTDEAAATAAEERMRDAQADLDDIEAELRVPEVMERLSDQIEYTRGLVDRVGSEEDRAELADIERRYAAVAQDRDADAGERLSDRLLDLQVVLLRRDGSLDLEVFNALRAMQGQMTDPARARELIREGERMVSASNWAALPDVNRRLRKLLPDQGRDVRSGVQRKDRP
ncbi:Hsp70 family protein [Amycolatopsis jiangsuensis]|uniref:Molecular chaperone DnaK n=1 Tax=Amycolatopsis jiangsuensis TaxID=1181879 RepID=A0A840J4R9_9PSEU|nr:Hsp70 family protein [Amycolatopsis jiangsuensis]MBB4688422.1 molecular chaperone DnaK [Amycolatopsis jiangsuensis]